MLTHSIRETNNIFFQILSGCVFLAIWLVYVLHVIGSTNNKTKMYLSSYVIIYFYCLSMRRICDGNSPTYLISFSTRMHAWSVYIHGKSSLKRVSVTRWTVGNHEFIKCKLEKKKCYFISLVKGKMHGKLGYQKQCKERVTDSKVAKSC